VFLAAAGKNDIGDFGARLEALRVLALTGDWQFIDAYLHRCPLHPDAFETALGLGDLALSRARATLGQPAIDDDGAMTAEIIALVAPDHGQASVLINEAQRRYREAGQFAEEQDRRLETGWYSHTVQQRQALLELTTSRVR
jgi:hypothetical protein